MFNKFIHISSLFAVLALTACVAAPEEDDEAASDAGDTTGDIEEATLALSDITLNPGQEATFPTWSWWGWTNVKITNNDSKRGCVMLHVSSFWEELCAEPGESSSVARRWAGLQLFVRNTEDVPLRVQVW
ncbi:hypothetical protein [Sorangium sp. So ce406]|uniref:hypothetical protein n=1 Tax=Sorangium sp. So ce406 TaxID=3133311 RepID=UPI003F5BF485